MSLHSLGIPDLPQNAFMRGEDGRIKPQGGGGKGGGSKPDTPDYAAAARETSEGNLEAAKYATQANRVNQHTPWGDLMWSSDRQFNQDAYDRDLASYNQARADYNSNMQKPYVGGFNNDDWYYNPYLQQRQSSQAAPVAPNATDYYTGGDNWSQTVRLSPEMQALFDQEMRLQQGMFGAQNQASDRVNAMLGTGFDTSSLPAQATVNGQALNSGNLTQFGQMGNVLDINGLPQSGTALDINGLPQMGTAFQPTGRELAAYDPSLQTNNATDLIMQRLNPQLDQQQEGLRSQLANQGIVQGTEAYDRAMMQHQQSRNDAQRGAALEGINLGMQQQGLQFNQGLQNRGLIAGEQAQQFAQQQGLRQGEAGLRGQQFAQQQGLREMAAALQAQQYGQQTTNYGLTAQQRAQQAAEQNQTFNQQQSLFAQQQAARNNALQEQSFLRSLPMNELNALRTGNQVGMPQFASYAPQATTGGADMLGAAQATYNANMNSYNAGQAQQSGFLGGLGGIGGGILGGMYGGPTGAAAGSQMGMGIGGMFSDRRLKTNIRRIGQADNGLSIYSYNYIWGGPAQIGYMADEVEQVAPHAVGVRDGFKTVDYGAL